MGYSHLNYSIIGGGKANILPYFATTLPELISNSVIIGPERGIVFVEPDGSESKLSYNDLLADASRVLSGLRLNGLMPGDKVVMQVGDDRLFLTAFWGVILGGGVPVPIGLPHSFPISEGSEKISKVCSLIGDAVIVTDQMPSEYYGLGVKAVLSVKELACSEPDVTYHFPKPDDMAYIRFSSGSTPDANGVILTHRNILANIYAIIEASSNPEQLALRDEMLGNPLKEYDVPYTACSWLPYSHDMGLTGFHLTPMAAGMNQIKMPSAAFMVNPELSLKLIDKYRVTQIPGPNISLFCMYHMVNEENIRGIDLSSVEAVFNGAEPISPKILRLFVQKFSRFGFNPKAMFPVYGMTETSLLIAAPPRGAEALFRSLDREAFSKGNMAVEVKDDFTAIEFVDEGYPVIGMELRIVDDRDRVVVEGKVGNIQIKGPNLTGGYYMNDDANRELFCNEWTRTGDLGFVKNGRLTVTGLNKDVIFVNGQNFHSNDIEEEIQQLPFFGYKNMAVCGVADYDKGEEKIVLFIKTRKSNKALSDQLAKINEHLNTKIKVGIEAIVPLNSIPRTSSGKIQKFKLKEKYNAGDYKDIEIKRINPDTTPSTIKDKSEEILQERRVIEPIPSYKKDIDLAGMVNDLPYAHAENNVHQFLPMIIKNMPQVLRTACIIAPDAGILHVDEQGREHLQTYRDLLNSAEKVLGGLRAHGYKPGDQAILQIDFSRNFLAAFWGVILGGIIPVPLPIPGTFPISEGMERITKVCSVLDRFCIITDQPAQVYESLGNVNLLDIRELLEHSPDSNHHNPKPDDIAYLQFSSGSTGDPKGVMLTHFNLIYTIDASAKCVLDVRGNDIRPTIGFGIHILRHKLSKSKDLISKDNLFTRIDKSPLGKMIRSSKLGKDILDTLLIFTGRRISAYNEMKISDIKIVNWMPYSHDMGLIGFHIAPTVGGMDQIKLEPKTFIQNPALFLRLIDKYRATHVPGPNFALQWLNTQVSDDDIKGIDLACIKSLVNGSEPISPTVSRDFINKFEKFGFDSRAMYMSYGMAEASLQVTTPPVFTDAIFHKANKDVFVKEQILIPGTIDEESIEITDVGAPVAGMKIRIVDDNDNMLHENTVGHIQIQGPNVVKGYFNNEAANRDLFCGEWLRTGDMGFMKNGRISITGRRKDIIFVNGQNLYAHDIEEQVRLVPGMAFREFAVTGLRDMSSDSERIVLFINTAESKMSLVALLARINELLVARSGVRIDVIVPVNEIPRTPSAKVKRYSLRDQFEKGQYETVIYADDAGSRLTGAADETEYVFTQTEQRLIDIWSEVLGISRISRHDNFFDLGGNSLKATKVTSRISEEFSIEMIVRSIFENQTIESLARFIDAKSGYGTVKADQIKPLAKSDYYEVSHAQKRLWLLDKVVPDSPFYNIPGAVLIEGIELDLDILRKSIQLVVDKHESLRTVFKTINSEPAQVIHDQLSINMSVTDLAGQADRMGRLEAIISEEKTRPFNLEEWPLFRVRIIKLSPDSQVFMIVMHHIISDGWSMGILVQEVVGNYFALSTGARPANQQLSVQYKDYAYWQNRLLEGDSIREQEKYWLENLSGTLPILNLPTDRQRPAVQTQRAETARIKIGKPTLDALRELSRKEGVTMFMLTLALFDVMLSKLSGQEDIIVGSPIAGRNNTQIEPLIGFFVNVLPVRIDISGNPTVSELFKRVKNTAIGAYANQDYPFDRLVEVINPVRDLSRSPIFDVTFEFREASASPFAGVPGLTVKDITGDDPNSRFDMSVTGYEETDGITMKFEYNADLFDRESIERFMKYYHAILCKAVECSERRISEVDMLDESERNKLIFGFNETKSSFDAGVTALDMFRGSIAPGRTAVSFKGNDVSYEKLDRMTDVLASNLMSGGIRHGNRVAILANRGLHLITAQLSVWKAGAAFVLIDPQYPQERIKFMVEDSESAIVLTTSDLMENITDSGIETLCLDKFDYDKMASLKRSFPSVCPDDLAYVIYTSGSTGKPKGSQIGHKSLSNLVQWHISTFGVTHEDRASNLAGVAFDATIWELWPYLCCGSCIVPLEKSLGQMIPENLAEFFIDNKITRAFVPTKFTEIFSGLDFPGLALKTIFTGGDRLTFIPKKQTYSIINCYGPTEATVLVTACDVTDWDNSNGNPTIGYPISNARVYILDGYKNPVPVGVIGELFIGGIPVGLGYLGAEQKTSKAFTEDPFNPGGRMYSTGDLARWNSDGSIDFIGRSDLQVEIRGYRVELGEIESVLSSYAGVRECVVIDKADSSGSVKLYAFVVADDADVSSMLIHLREHLPGYMIPSRIIPIDHFPVTPNGKLDREALLALIDEQISTGEYVAPRDRIEEIMVAVWKEILKVDSVGIHDNFFDLGGDSIISLQVVSKLAQHGIKIQPKDIMRYQNIAELARVAETVTGTSAEQGEVTGIAPLTPIQSWFFEQDFKNPNQFNQAILFECGIRLHEPALEKALHSVIEHHDALRTRFTGGKQETMPYGYPGLFVVREVDSLEGINRESQTFQSGFDIENGPVFGVALLRGPEKDYLLFAGHHLVVDGVSWRILIEDMFASYLAAYTNADLKLPAKTTSFKAWANAVDAYASNRSAEAELEFWKEQTVSSSPIKTDVDLGPNDTGSAETVGFELDEILTLNLLRNAHNAYNTEINDLMLTALALTLMSFTGESYAAFDLESHGREDFIEGMDISRTVGWFTSMYPVKLKVGGQSLAPDIKHVKEYLRGIPSKGFNYSVLKHILGFDIPSNALVSFNYLGQLTQSGEKSPLKLMKTDLQGTIDNSNERPNLIDMICMVVDSRLKVDIVYSANKFLRSTMESFCDKYRENLNTVINHCLDPDNFDITPSDFGIAGLSQDELDHLADFS